MEHESVNAEMLSMEHEKYFALYYHLQAENRLKRQRDRLQTCQSSGNVRNHYYNYPRD